MSKRDEVQNAILNLIDKIGEHIDDWDDCPVFQDKIFALREDLTGLSFPITKTEVGKLIKNALKNNAYRIDVRSYGDSEYYYYEAYSKNPFRGCSSEMAEADEIKDLKSKVLQ